MAASNRSFIIFLANVLVVQRQFLANGPLSRCWHMTVPYLFEGDISKGSNLWWYSRLAFGLHVFLEANIPTIICGHVAVGSSFISMCILFSFLFWTVTLSGFGKHFSHERYISSKNLLTAPWLPFMQSRFHQNFLCNRLLKKRFLDPFLWPLIRALLIHYWVVQLWTFKHHTTLTSHRNSLWLSVYSSKVT